MAKRRYRSKGGWIMGSFWQDGRIGELHEEQAAAFLEILEPLDEAGKPIAAVAVDAAPTPLANLPPPVSQLPAPQRKKQRPGMSTPIGLPTRVAASTIDATVEKK